LREQGEVDPDAHTGKTDADAYFGCGIGRRAEQHTESNDSVANFHQFVLRRL
jgi:hypothetical protein